MDYRRVNECDRFANPAPSARNHYIWADGGKIFYGLKYRSCSVTSSRLNSNLLTDGTQYYRTVSLIAN